MVRQITGLTGNMEVDETYIGGKRGNMRKKKRNAFARLGRGIAGKAIVNGSISRKTGKVVLPVILDTGWETLHAFVEDVAQEGVTVYTCEHEGHVALEQKPITLNRSGGG